MSAHQHHIDSIKRFIWVLCILGALVVFGLGVGTGWMLWGP